MKPLIFCFRFFDISRFTYGYLSPSYLFWLKKRNIYSKPKMEKKERKLKGRVLCCGSRSRVRRRAAPVAPSCVRLNGEFVQRDKRTSYHTRRNVAPLFEDVCHTHTPLFVLPRRRKIRKRSRQTMRQFTSRGKRTPPRKLCNPKRVWVSNHWKHRDHLFKEGIHLLFFLVYVVVFKAVVTLVIHEQKTVRRQCLRRVASSLYDDPVTLVAETLPAANMLEAHIRVKQTYLEHSWGRVCV